MQAPPPHAASRRPRAPAALPVALALLGSLALVGCGRSDDRAEAEVRRRDAEALREALLADPALPLLLEVRRVVEDDLPVRASELLEEVAIPAARRQVEALGAVEVHTAEGRALRRRAEEAFGARLAALRDYQRALARGPVEDLELLQAVRALREAEEELAAVHGEVSRLAGEAPEEEPIPAAEAR